MGGTGKSVGAVRGEYGLPRVFHALAMTRSENAVHRRRGDVGIVLRIGGGAADGGTVHTFFIFFPVAKFVEKFYNV